MKRSRKRAGGNSGSDDEMIMLQEEIVNIVYKFLDIITYVFLFFINMIVTILTLFVIFSYNILIFYGIYSCFGNLLEAIRKKEMGLILIFILVIGVLVALLYPSFWLMSGGLTEDWWQFWKWQFWK